MLRLLLMLVGVLVLGGCIAPAELRLSATERARCIKDAEEWDLISFGATVDCKEFGERRVVKGVWFTGFEETGFIEGVQTVPLTRMIDGTDPSFRTYLHVPRGRIYRSMRAPPIRNGCTMAVYVEFLGRKVTRRVPEPAQGDKPTFKVERVLKSRYLGQVSSYHDGELYRDCRN